MVEFCHGHKFLFSRFVASVLSSRLVGCGWLACVPVHSSLVPSQTPSQAPHPWGLLLPSLTAGPQLMFWESPSPIFLGYILTCSCVESLTSKIHIFDFWGLFPCFPELNLPISSQYRFQGHSLLRTCMSSNMFILFCHSSSSMAGPLLDLVFVHSASLAYNITSSLPPTQIFTNLSS